MNIYQVSDINTIPFDNFTDNTLVAFDLDETVICEALNPMNIYYRNNFIATLKEINADDPDKVDDRLCHLFDHMPYKLVDDSLPGILSQHNLITIGFTARLTGFATSKCEISSEDLTLSTLNKLDIKFTANFPDNIFDLMPDVKLIDPSFISFTRPGKPMIKNNVLFTNNVDKGTVLEMLFVHFGFFPQTFVMIDDNYKNLESAYNAITKINDILGHNIEFVGYHYTKYRETVVSLDPDIVKKQIDGLTADVPILYGDDGSLIK